MSPVETRFCRSALWGRAASSLVLPWAMQGVVLSGQALEIGSGSGAMAAALVKRHPQVRLTASDVDEQMVAALRRRLSATAAVAVEEADSTRLPFAAESFDYVVSFLMLHHVVQWPSALSEVRRVLRPGGRLIGYDLTDTLLARAVHVVDRSPHRLIGAQQLDEQLRRLGFRPRVRTGLGGLVMRIDASKD